MVEYQGRPLQLSKSKLFLSTFVSVAAAAAATLYFAPDLVYDLLEGHHGNSNNPGQIVKAAYTPPDEDLNTLLISDSNPSDPGTSGWNEWDTTYGANNPDGTDQTVEDPNNTDISDARAYSYSNGNTNIPNDLIDPNTGRASNPGSVFDPGGLVVASRSSGAGGGGDPIPVATIPLPPAAALMLTGLGMTGWFVRHRKSNA